MKTVVIAKILRNSLDSSGNSVKAQLAIKYIMNKLGLSIFGSTRFTITG